MIAETAAWLKSGEPQADRDARRVRFCWLREISVARGPTEADQVGRRWATAFGAVRPGAEHKLQYELKWEFAAARKSKAGGELEAAAKAGRPVDLFFSEEAQPSGAAQPEEPEPEPEAKADAGVGRPITVSFSKDKPVTDVNVSIPLLSKDAAYDSARAYAQWHCWKEGSLGVYAWRGKFWEWNGRVYRELADLDLRSRVYEFLDGSRKKEKVGDGSFVTGRFRPQKSQVSNLLDALQSGLALPNDLVSPIWLDTGRHAGEVMVFQNRMLDLRTGALAQPTPRLWMQGELGYEWRPEAGCPGWLAFLESIFPGDDEAKACVEEGLGLSMTEDISFQKGFLLVGKPRAGKGTILGVLEALIGPEAYVSLDLEKWQSGENSMERLIGCKALVFPDVRLRPPKWYGPRFDPGGIDYVSAQHLLKTTSGDPVSIGRKWNAIPWKGRLPGKVWMAMNKVPNFNDTVLPTRFVKLAFDISFLGRQDNHLLDRLKGELSGIAARCLGAYHRARDRGQFIQPRSAERLEAEIAQGSDPFTQFMADTFIADPSGTVRCGSAFFALQIWCGKHGHQDLLDSVTNKNMRKRIRGVLGFEEVDSAPRPHGEARSWKGLRFAKGADRPEEED